MPRKRPQPTPARPRILLAEDDCELRSALASLLEHDGYQVHAVASGAALLDYLGTALLGDGPQPADVIVTDVRMPGFNGLSIAEGLRANGWQQPIVVITAFDDATIRARVDGLGAARLFGKPFELQAVEQAIASFLAPPPSAA
jgi:CheY-like chemotaxis protein